MLLTVYCGAPIEMIAFSTIGSYQAERVTIAIKAYSNLSGCILDVQTCNIS